MVCEGGRCDACAERALILANVAQSAMATTDLMMRGWLSPKALAAGALGFNSFRLRGVVLPIGALLAFATALPGAA